jgi:hypothetical protein
MGGAYGTYEWEERCIEGFGVETCEKKTLGRLKCRWEYNNKLDVQEVGWRAGFIDLVRDKDCCKRGNVPSCSIKCEKFLE